MGIKDREIPRTLMEVMYFKLERRAIINWIEILLVNNSVVLFFQFW